MRPDYKVYDSEDVFQAGCKEPHAAALLAEHYGGTVRWHHKATVWRVGDPSPTESLDAVASFIFAACDTHRKTKHTTPT